MGRAEGMEMGIPLLHSGARLKDRKGLMGWHCLSVHHSPTTACAKLHPKEIKQTSQNSEREL
jgi:hypothetical protein